MRARIAMAGMMLLLAGTAAAAPAVPSESAHPGRPAAAVAAVRRIPLMRGRSWGPVTAVDVATGRIEMAAEGVTLGASFPPAVVARSSPATSVFVTVSVIDTRVATVTGSIAAVDQAKGTAT